MMPKQSRGESIPSIEPTANGWPRYTAGLLSVSRGQPLSAAHVKRVRRAWRVT